MELLRCCKVKASSLTESIIAMVIVAVCMSITMVAYVRVLEADRNLPSYSAEQRVKELLWETERSGQFENEDYSFASYTISKEVDELFSDEGIYKVVFTVKTGKKQNKYQYIIANQ